MARNPYLVGTPDERTRLCRETDWPLARWAVGNTCGAHDSIAGKRTAIRGRSTMHVLVMPSLRQNSSLTRLRRAVPRGRRVRRTFLAKTQLPGRPLCVPEPLSLTTSGYFARPK